MNPAPVGTHERVLALLVKQLMGKSAIEVLTAGNRGLETPFGHVHPDLTVAEPMLRRRGVVGSGCGSAHGRRGDLVRAG